MSPSAKRAQTSAYTEVASTLRETPAMKEFLASLEMEPFHLLAEICNAYDKAQEPVPDYRLTPGGYLSEMSLRALLQASFVDDKPSGRDAMRAFQPTPKGLEYYRRLKEEGFYTEGQHS